MTKPKAAKPQNREPAREATRKSTQPKTPQEQVQAIADDLKAEIISYIYRYALEQQLVLETVQRALGVGGGKLEEFIDELTSQYAKTVPGNESNQEIREDKEVKPDLKMVSKIDKSVQVILPKDKKGNVSRSSTRSTGKK